MTQSSKWHLRLVVAINAVLACLLVFFGQNSTVSAALYASGLFGVIALSALLGLGVVAVADVIVNDILPSEYQLHCGLKYRHTIYMLLALGCLSLVFVMVKNGVETYSVATLHYAAIALPAVALAVTDIFDRIHGNPR